MKDDYYVNVGMKKRASIACTVWEYGMKLQF
jgi:hypothetical protein